MTTRREFIQFLSGCLLSMISACQSRSSKQQRGPSLSFAQLTDTHIGAEGFSSKRLAEVIARLNEIKPDFVIHTGDLLDSHGDSLSEWEAYQTIFANLRIPFYAVPGNHDTGKTPTPARQARWKEYVGTERFSFVHSDAAFIGADFTPFWQPNWKRDVEIARQREETVLWLSRELQQAENCRSRFVFGHFPIYLTDMDTSDEVENCICELETRQQLLDALLRGRCDTYFCGHTHFGWQNLLTLSGQSHHVRQVVAPSLARPWSLRRYSNHPFLQEQDQSGWYLWRYYPDTGELEKEFVEVPGALPTIVVDG